MFLKSMNVKNKILNFNTKVMLVVLIVFFVTEAEVHAGFPENESDYYMEDEIVGHVHRPHVVRRYEWPEYKKDSIILKTNNLGFREDSDTNVKKLKDVIRILVTGDSQIDGVVNNSESFPNVLEAQLNSTNQTFKFEVINGGVGHYGFEHYELFLHKYLFLKPDKYIVVIYTGNDFLDSARIVEVELGFNGRPPQYLASLQKCMHDGITSQVMNQIYYFKTFPQMREKVIKHVIEIMLRVNELCKQYKIDFMVVFLPTKADVEWKTDNRRLEEEKECLGFSEADLSINKDLKDDLIKFLFQHNIKYIDIYKDMVNKNVEFYWKKDYHLNDQGHRFLADMVYEKCNEFLQVKPKR